MNWLSHISKQASRLASLELFRYIYPVFPVTVGFIAPEIIRHIPFFVTTGKYP